MAIGTSSDITVYNEEIHTGMTEVEAQQVDVFNQNSNGTIQLSTQHHDGHYAQQARFDTVSSLVSRRVTTSTSTATVLKITDDEHIGVKVSRKIGPVEHTKDSLRKVLQGSPNETRTMRLFTRAIGRQAGVAILVDMVNTALSAAEAAIDNVAALNHDGTAATLKHTALNSGLALFGDRAGSIRAWAMHSAPFFDLAGNAIGTSGFDSVASGIIQFGESRTGTLGRPAIITDSSALTTGAGSTLQYQVLGLVQNAIRVDRDFEPEVFVETVGGKENLTLRYQAEYDFTLFLKGYKWKTASGANPDASTIATGSNWTKIATDDKDTAGVHVNVSG